jgi:ABC-2 type transport system permease protein
MTPLAGTPRLIRFILRRDRIRIAVWVLAIGISVMGSVATFADTYPTAADRQTRAETMDNAMASLFTGPGYGLDDYDYGPVTANEMLPITALTVALMSIFLVVRHTRAEEESERAELVRAAAVGRHAPITAALIVVGAVNLLLGALITVGLPASLEGLSPSGSFAFAAAVTGVGLVFAGVAALTAQLTVSGRGAVGIASMVLGFVYLLRAVGDMGKGTLSWLSPFGWATEIRAYVDKRFWPLSLFVVLTAVAVWAAVAINGRRDVGAGIIADRPGRATASRRLGSSFGLALRLQRASLMWWGISMFLLGLLYGGIAREGGELYEELEALDEYLARLGVADPADQYLALTLFVSALIATGYTIQSTLRLRSEETALRAEPVLATTVDRRAWAGSHLAMALGGSLVLLLMLGLGAGIARAISVGDAGELPRLIGAALAYAPALWVFAGLAAMLFGLFPRAVGVAWGALGVVVFIGWLGPFLKLPDWAYDVSPLEHVPRLPVAEFSMASELVLLAVSVALVAVGLGAFRRRDLASG